MSKYVNVMLVGCDGRTDFKLEATPQIMSVLRSLQAISHAQSDYDCQPVLLVEDDQGRRMWEEDLDDE